MTDYKKLKEMLIEKGASFVGFSSVKGIPEAGEYSGAITIGIKLLDSYFEEVKKDSAPTYEYFHHYRTVNFALDQLALCASLPKAVSIASGTSGPVSKQQREMHGPIAARISAG